MTIDPEISRQLITLLSDRDNPVSVHKALDLIVNPCIPTGMRRKWYFIFSMSMTTGRVVPHEETGLPTTIIKSNRLAV